MAAKDLGDLIAGFAPEGPLRTIVYVAYGLCAAIASLVFAYYLKLLAHGGAELGSIERHDYERLRASLKEGNLAAQLYVKWLTKFLDWIEDFFGDAGMADRTLFPHAFGLKTPAPLWTARALDRCLLLALIYPFATIFLIWAISGHVGPAEHALGLLSDVSGPWRALFAVAWALSCFRLWRTQRTQFVIWLSAFAVIALALAIAFAVVVHGAAASALGVFVGLGVLVAAKAGVELTGAAAFSFTILLAVFLSAMIALDFPLLNLSAETIDFVYGGYAGAFVGTVVTVCAGAIFLSYGFAFVSCFALGFSVMFVELPHVAAIKNRFEGVFFSFFLPAAILVSLSSRPTGDCPGDSPYSPAPCCCFWACSLCSTRLSIGLRSA